MKKYSMTQLMLVIVVVHLPVNLFFFQLFLFLNDAVFMITSMVWLRRQPWMVFWQLFQSSFNQDDEVCDFLGPATALDVRALRWR